MQNKSAFRPQCNYFWNSPIWNIPRSKTLNYIPSGSSLTVQLMQARAIRLHCTCDSSCVISFCKAVFASLVFQFHWLLSLAAGPETFLVISTCFFTMFWTVDRYIWSELNWICNQFLDFKHNIFLESISTYHTISRIH